MSITTPPNPSKCLHVVVLEQLQPVSQITLRYPSLYASLQATNIPAEQFTGYLSLTILELNIHTLYQRSQLFCTEWFIPIPTHSLHYLETYHLQLRRPPLRQHHSHEMQTMRDQYSSPHKPPFSTLSPHPFHFRYLSIETSPHLTTNSQYLGRPPPRRIRCPKSRQINMVSYRLDPAPRP